MEPSGASSDAEPEQVEGVIVSPALAVDDGIAWVTFDDPVRSQNVLTEAVMGHLAAILEELEQQCSDGTVRGVVFRSNKPKSFIAGADVDLIAALEDPLEAAEKIRTGQELYDRIEALPVPTLAAISGVCLGGGTELALACTYRVASDHKSTAIGLPEVQLGILPAWGGTTRLPRLIGLRAALDLILTGRTVSPRKARRIGLVSEVLPHALLEASAKDFVVRARTMPEGASRRKRGVFDRVLEGSAPGRLALLRAARASVMAKTGGHYPAPLKILRLLRDHAGGDPKESFAAEVRLAAELITGSVSKNLVHLFRLRENSKRAVTASKPRNVDTVAVVGAGVMGGGIAQLAAYNDLRVRVKDVRAEAVSLGLQHAQGLFDKAVERKKIDRASADRRMALISAGLEYHGFASSDVVIEAVVERMDVKRQVLREVEEQVSAECVLATNTSSLSVEEMADALHRPDRFAGLHFFNPVHKMPLVEIVRGEKTSDQALATLHDFVLTLGKVPVVCRDGAGFLVNRILGPYLNEAGWLLAEGASVESIDRSAVDFGMPMGPIRLLDEIGIDVARHAGDALRAAFGSRMDPSPPLIRIGETERLGRKGGLGFYQYREGREDGVDPEIYSVLGEAVPLDRTEATSREIRSRLVLAMINEAARVLGDGIVDRAADVDLGMVMGAGFPPFRGGLLRFADNVHLRHIANRLEELEGRIGQRFEPAPVIVELARRDRRFYEAFA